MAPRTPASRETPLPFNAGDWYGDPRCSDITIKYSGKELKAHKLILCAGSKYFERALAEDGGFEESGAGEIEVHDDYPEILEDALKFVYTARIDTDWSKSPVEIWARWLKILFVADKYAIKSLVAGIFLLLERTAEGLHKRADSDALVILMTRAAEFPSSERKMNKLITRICQTALRSHFESVAFREWLDNNDTLREPLYRENIYWLIKQTAFLEKIAEGGEFVNKVTDWLSTCPEDCDCRAAGPVQHANPNAGPS